VSDNPDPDKILNNSNEKKYCYACFKNKVVNKDSYECETPEVRELEHCDVYDTKNDICLLCDKGFMLIIDLYHNLCVPIDVENIHCLIKSGEYCKQCQIFAYMDTNMKCLRRGQNHYYTLVIICLVILFLILAVYGFYLYKCKRKFNRRKKNRRNRRVEPLM
jgi:hypothetical protein